MPQTQYLWDGAVENKAASRQLTETKVTRDFGSAHATWNHDWVTRDQKF